MDDKNDKSTPTRPGVMDVQRPSRAAQASTPSPAPESPAPIEPVEAPAETPAETAPPAEDKPPTFDAAAAQAEADKMPHQDNADPKDPHAKADHLLAAHAQKKHHPKMPIVIAAIVALVLAGLAVMAYMNGKHSTKGTGDDHNTTQEHQPSMTPATTQDVDDANKDVDQTTNSVDDAADMPEAELNDQSLGL